MAASLSGELACGNARLVRNLIERAIRKQAVRLMQTGSSSREELMLIAAGDLGEGGVLRRTAVIGRPNAGKTAFTISFATYLGFQSLRFVKQTVEGKLWSWNCLKRQQQPASSRQRPTKPLPFKPWSLSALWAKASGNLNCWTPAALWSGIHPERNIRLAMAQSLQLIKDADLVLHVIDAAAVGRNQDSFGVLEEELASWGGGQGQLSAPGKQDGPCRLQGQALQQYRVFFFRPACNCHLSPDRARIQEVKKYVLRIL